MTHYTTLVQRCRATNALLANELYVEFERLEYSIVRLRGALEMVRDADEDCKKDGLKTIPHFARASIDEALKL